MKGICLNGWNNTAPTELKKWRVQKCYDDVAPTELIAAIESPISQMIYQLYKLTTAEIKIVKAQ